MDAKKDLKAMIRNRYDFVLLFDVTDGNPNGDPDAGNLPRLDPQTGQGFTTDGCIKRKIRNAIEVIKGVEAQEPDRDEALHDRLRYEIYFKHQGILNDINRRASKALGIEVVEGKAEDEAEEENGDEELKSRTPMTTRGASKRKEKKVLNPDTAPQRVEQARRWMCRNFYDVRTFGAVMSTGVNAGQVRGPVQLTYARSVDPIVPLECSITRKSVNDEKKAQEQIERHGYITGTMGRSNKVPYGFYRAHGFINPFLALGEAGTGFTYGDLHLFFDALLRMFDFSSSSSQGTMAIRGVHLFEHESILGNARASELLERVRIMPLSEDSDPAVRARAPRKFDDYKGRILVDSSLPRGVTYYELPKDFDRLFPNGSGDGGEG